MPVGVLQSFFYGISSPLQRWRDSALDKYLVTEGLSEEEAGDISWIIQHRAKGRGYGFIIGCASAFVFQGQFRRLRIKYPRIFYNKFGVPLLNAAMILGWMHIGCYFQNFQRPAANSWFSNFYVNKRYIETKNNFVRNFEVLNRNFTEDEVKQFLHNEDLQVKGKKKYVYNPALHATEEEYKKEYERINSGEFRLSTKSKEEITASGQNKVNAGEEIVDKPYDNRLIDHSNLNLRLITNQAAGRIHILG